MARWWDSKELHLRAAEIKDQKMERANKARVMKMQISNLKRDKRHLQSLLAARDEQIERLLEKIRRLGG